MIHSDITLQEHILDVTVAERVAQIPGNGLDDERRSLKSVLARRLSFAAMADRNMFDLRKWRRHAG
jgi:hypothetical protein